MKIDLAVLIFGFFAFLIGALVGYLASRLRAQKGQGQIQALQAEVNQSKFAYEFMQKELAEKKALAQEIKKELEESFRMSSSEILEEKSKKLLELAHMSFKNETDLQEKTSAKREQQLQKEFKDLFLQIQTYQNKLNEFEKERERTLGLVEGQLKNIAETGTYLGQQTQSLKEALTKPNIRGRWGELQLKNCVEFAGMSEFCDFTTQEGFVENDKALKPDLIIRLPSGKRIIVDSKTPMDSYLKSIDEASEDQKKQFLKEHAQRLKAHIRELGSKRYFDAVGFESLDQVIMFLPNESFLYAALEADREIIEYALGHKVLIATPPTFIALLRAIHMGWGEHKVSQNVRQIYDQSKELQKRLQTFTDTFYKIEDFLQKSLDAFKKAKNSFEGRVLVQARRIESLEEGLEPSKEEPVALRPADDEIL